jgi:hypothetical protein
MAFIAPDPHAKRGLIVGSGHCMALVQAVAGVPHSARLRRGAKVRDATEVPIGTIIGTFDATGRYANATDGSSHVAILLARQSNGLLVIDQWVGQRVHERVLQYRGGQGAAANDGDQFYIVEAEATA